jgi:4-amino-4-deoxy-L-arabinose transferase-like glycosyltransferase
LVRPVVAAPPPHPARDRALTLHVLAATLVAVALRAFHLGAQSLWIDEAFTWLGADTGRPLRLAALLENVHGPLYGLIIHLWTGLAGDPEWALRAPSLLFGVAAVPAMAWLAGRWLGRDAAPWAAWLAAASPFLVWYGQEARNYSLLILCVCLAGAVLLTPIRRPLGHGAAVLALAWAGLLSNFSFGLLAPLYLRWWLTGGDGGGGRRGGWRSGLPGALALALVLALLVAPWVPQVRQAWDWRRLEPAYASGPGETPLRGSTTFHAAAIPFALHALAVGYSLGPSLRELHGASMSAALRHHLPEIAGVTLVFGLLGFAGLVTLVRRRRLLDALLWIGVPLLAVSFFALRNFKVFHPRYLAVLAPVFLLVLAAGLAGLRRPLRIAAALAVGLLWAASLGHHYFDPRYAKEDYRDALRLVAERGRPGEKVLAVGAEEPIYYYYRGPLSVDRLWLGYVARPRRLEEELGARLAGANGAWVVLSRPEDLDPGGVFARTLEARAVGAEEFRFPGVRVWHVDPYARPRPRAPEDRPSTR